MYVTHKVCTFAVGRTYQRRNVDVQLRGGRTNPGREGVAIDGVIQVDFWQGKYGVACVRIGLGPENGRREREEI